MAGVECDSFMVESENRDEWIAGDETRELKYRRIESTYVDCDNVDSALEILMWEVEMGKEKLKKERKEVEELSQEVEKLRKRMPPKNPDLCDEDEDEDEDSPLCSFEIYEERTKQHRAFEQLLRDTSDIKFYSTVDDVKKMIKISKHRYPLLKRSDRYRLINVRLYMLELIEEERIMTEYRNEIYKKIVVPDDLIKQKYEDYMYANGLIGSLFDDSRLKKIFKSSILSSIPYVMIAKGRTGEVTLHDFREKTQCLQKELKKFILTSMEEKYRLNRDRYENWSLNVREYED